MKMNGNAMQSAVSFSKGNLWETFNGWAAEHLTREWALDIALTLAAIGSAGFVLLTLHKIGTNCTMTGF